MRIIPAIDIIDGRCVRLTQGDYAQKTVYREDPLEVAKEFEQAGIQYLHLVDLDGAKAGKVVNWEVAERLCNQTNLVIDFGGGIKTKEDIQRLLDLGVKQVNLGSIAVKNPTLVMEWLEVFGSACIILSADVKNEMIAINGWQDNSTIHLLDFIKQYEEKGLRYVTCTDISTDGTLKGPNVELYKKILEHHPKLKLVASGGVGTMDDVKKLSTTPVDGVIIGKAIYEGRISINDLTP